ncbi:MAG: DNA primase [Patescibacteria group bacterium]
MSQETDEIKSKLDLVDFISEYVKLIPAGANLKARCPFHNEKTPSFMVNRQKQIWRCFGCSEGGDIFTFLMKIENLEFPEALKILAQRAGVVLRRQSPIEESNKNRLIDLCELAAKYWHKVLLESPLAGEAREYLKQRGISDETISDYRLGYAVESWDDLIKFLAKKGFSEREISEAGLAVPKNQGAGFYDRFRARIMFPILNLHGQAVGFGGRTLKSDEPAKYINTSQTAVYNKSAILYGFYQAKEAVKQNDLCVLVEGYMDVLPSHQIGVKNVVSISGTVLTIDQIRILKRYANNLALALDMDEAGLKAAERSIDLALEEEMDVKVITLPFGKDPGECVQNNPDDWRQAILSARPAMEYYFAFAWQNFNPASPEGKKKAAKFLLQKISGLGNPVERDYWVRKLAQKLSVSEGILRELILKNKIRRRAPKESAKRSVIVSDADAVLFKRTLAIILAFPKFFGELSEGPAAEFWQESRLGNIYKDLVMFYTKNSGSFDDKEDFDLFDQLLHYFEEINASEESNNLLNESYLMARDEFAVLEENDAKAEWAMLVKIAANNFFKKKIDQLQLDLEEAERRGAREAVDKVYAELCELIRQRSAL